MAVQEAAIDQVIRKHRLGKRSAKIVRFMEAEIGRYLAEKHSCYFDEMLVALECILKGHRAAMKIDESILLRFIAEEAKAKRRTK